MIRIFYDLETTGTNHKLHSIHQISGIIEENGYEVERFDLYMRPHPNALIEPEAMTLCRVTEEDIMLYPLMEETLLEFKKILSFYIDKYDPKDKAHLLGFNNRAFDDKFLRKWFEICGDIFIGSWFWTDTIDVICLASEYLRPVRSEMPSFKLKRVAMQLGIEVDKEKLHDSMYDVELTREIYKRIT